MINLRFPIPGRMAATPVACHRLRIFTASLLLAAAAPAQTPRVAFGESIRDVTQIPESAVTRANLTAAEHGQTIEFAVVLKMRNFADLHARINRHERIPQADMARGYHPTPADYQAVLEWLKAEGFTIAPEDPSHLAVFASGTVAQVVRSFQTRFSRVSFRGRERSSAVTAPTLPEAIAPVVLGVNGLQPQFIPQKHSIQQRALPAGSITTNSTTGNGPPFLPNQIMRAYGAAGLAQTGAGQTIGIVIDTPPATTDLTKFWTTCGIAQSLSNIQTIQVVAGTLPAPSGEESLDVEWSSSIAPAAKVRVYATIDLSFTHLDQAYARIYSDLPSQPGLRQVSLSYGLGEAYTSSSQMQTDEQYFANLASAGVTVFVSSGDGGSNPTSTGTSGAKTPTVESPANSPSVIAVGGTSLTVNSSTGIVSSETTWSGSGGGMSNYFSRPAWQTGSGLPAGTTRAVPDVAAPADPNTGGVVILNGTSYQYGGTSWSAPIWAGIAALINQARIAGGLSPLGSFGPKIYPLLGTAAFRDITSGSNGTYSAGAGYDECTGIGVPNPATLLQTLVGAPSISTPPTSQFIASGGNATFSVVASGSGPLNYQWQRMPYGGSIFTNLTDNATYSGSATASLTITGAPSEVNGDQYQCQVTNAFGAVTSPPAQLILGIPLPPFVVTTVAGSAGVTGSSDGIRSVARFNYPNGIAVDGDGNLIIADTNNNILRQVSPGGAVTTIAGTAGTSGSSNTGTGTFSAPSNVAMDGSGNLYVADSGNSIIRKITPGGVITILAGRAGRTGSTNGTGSTARFNRPLGIAVDGAGTVYVADTGNNLIRRVSAGGTATTLAGAAGTSGSTDGTGTSARFNRPVDIAVDHAGNLYVADANNHTIRKLTAAGVATTFAGSAGQSGATDGIGNAARFNSPEGVRTDAAGNVLVADTNNHLIRLITPLGVVNTLAGRAGASGSQDGVGAGARFDYPSGAVATADGTIYIIDTFNQTLRMAQPGAAPVITGQPVSRMAGAGQIAVFTTTVTGNPAPTYQWQRLPAGAAKWLNLAEAAPYSGTTRASLTVTGVTPQMDGDQYQCVVTNTLGTATSLPAMLTLGAPPAITSAMDTRFIVGLPGAFTVTATGAPAPVISATGVPAWATFDAATGILSGTPPNAGGTPFVIGLAASNGMGPDATQMFTLAVETRFAGWASLQFGANANDPGIAGPAADPDHDGIPNLLEYTLGGDPLVASVTKLPTASLTHDPGDGLAHLTLTAVTDASATDVMVTAEVSSDLQSWRSGPDAVALTSDSSVNGVRTLVFLDTTPAAAGARYIRLRATLP